MAISRLKAVYLLMHEFSLAQEMLSMLEQIALEHRLKKITKITLQLGILSNVVPEALEFAFASLAKDTICEGAELVWEKVPVLARCQSCGEEYAAASAPFACPRCQNAQARILDGTHVTVANLEGEG